MRATVINLLCCTLLIVLLSYEFTLAADETEDLERAKCAEKLARRKERLENFKFTFADPRQANLFKYLSARSFDRPVPMSALRSQLKDFSHLNGLSQALPDEFIFHEMRHTFCAKASTPDCSISWLRAFRDRVQTIRDLHIDCWNSGEYLKILKENATILPYVLQTTDNSSGACDALKSRTIFNNRYDNAFEEIRRIQTCDEAQWRNLTGYVFKCHREKLPSVDSDKSRKMMASVDEIGDEINSLFDLSKQIDQNGTYYLTRDQVLFQSGDFENFFNPSLAHSYWEGLPFFEADDNFNEVVLNALSELVSNETSVVKARAFHLWKRIRTEMINVAHSQSELESHYTKNRYQFDTNKHDLLKLLKAAGSNWRFKYVHLANDEAFGVGMHNEKIFGQFIDNPDLPTNPIIERVRRLLNDLIKFYWDVMASRGVHSEAPKDVDYTVTCQYEKLYGRKARYDRYDSRNLYRIIVSNPSKPQDYAPSGRFRNVSSIMNHLARHLNTSKVFVDNGDVYVKMAMVLYEKFKDNDTEIRGDIPYAMTFLREKLSGVDNLPPVFFPKFVYEKDFISKCREDAHCEFLLSLQMIGSVFDLTFATKDSQEVFVGRSGLFVYFQSDEEPVASRRVRYLLNYLLHMFFNKDESSME
uniref:Peptidase M13 N-terminal domain-containing protein n=1 Tax=Bracon brevicornis TaxID=1563983 RepID=A0A6V7JGR6_9HYME